MKILGLQIGKKKRKSRSGYKRGKVTAYKILQEVYAFTKQNPDSAAVHVGTLIDTLLKGKGKDGEWLGIPVAVKEEPKGGEDEK